MLSRRETAVLCGSTAAVAAGDGRLTRVLCGYLLEQGVFARCHAYHRGRDLLRELAEGAPITALVLDEQLLDMTVEEFLAQAAVLELAARPAIFVLTRYRYYELSESLRPYDIARCVSRLTDPDRLVRAIRGWYSSRSAGIADRCSECYRQWGVQDRKRDCAYLTDAVQIVLNAGEEPLLRKQIFADVGHRHGVALTAVDSGLQRLIRATETKDTTAYREFLMRHGLRAVRLTPTRLVYALADELRSPAAGGEEKGYGEPGTEPGENAARSAGA